MYLDLPDSEIYSSNVLQEKNKNIDLSYNIWLRTWASRVLKGHCHGYFERFQVHSVPESLILPSTIYKILVLNYEEDITGKFSGRANQSLFMTIISMTSSQNRRGLVGIFCKLTTIWHFGYLLSYICFSLSFRGSSDQWPFQLPVLCYELNFGQTGRSRSPDKRSAADTCLFWSSSNYLIRTLEPFNLKICIQTYN